MKNIGEKSNIHFVLGTAVPMGVAEKKKHVLN